MEVFKWTLLSTLTMFANMVSLLAQTVEIVGIYPINPPADNGEPQMPEVIDEMIDEKILVLNEDGRYFVNNNLLNEYWEENARFPIMLEDGTIIREDSAIWFSPIQRLKFLVGQDTDAQLVDIEEIAVGTQDRRPEW